MSRQVGLYIMQGMYIYEMPVGKGGGGCEGDVALYVGVAPKGPTGTLVASSLAKATSLARVLVLWLSVLRLAGKRLLRCMGYGGCM